MIRIGEIDYLNCTPIFTILKNCFNDPDYSFVSGTPARLNGLLRQGELDLCPSSSIEYARNQGSYLIMPELSISAVGGVRSVLLFSKKPIEQLNGAKVLLTVESETSVALIKIILTRFYRFDVEFCQAEPGCTVVTCGDDALLLIGDSALKGALDPNGCHIYDLGELWRKFTGLPFVFALWLLRRESLDRDPAAIVELHRRLVDAKHIALESYSDIAASVEACGWLEVEALVDYWQTISYELTKEHLDGLKLFYEYAAELGIAPGEVKIDLMGN